MPTAATIRRTIRPAIAALLVAGGIAASTWSHSGQTALAPEPAKLKAALGSTAGATGAAYYVNSLQSTKVLYYTGSWTSDSWGPAAGTPCSPYSLAADAITTKVIQVMGNYRRCI